MNLTPSDPVEQVHFKTPPVVRAVLILVISVALATCAGLLVSAIVYVTDSRSSRDQTISIWALLAVLGLTSCGLLITGIAVYKLLSQILDRISALEQRAAILAERSVAQKRGESTSPYILEAIELKNMLLEIRETMLLPPEERVRRFELLVERELAQGLGVAEAFIRSRDFHRARQELRRLAERFGANERIREAADKVEKSAEAAQAEDMATARHLLSERIDAARWDEAEHLAREVLDKYPLSSDAAAMLIHVQRERKLYEQRNRLRLHDEIQQFVNQRRWIEAVEATRRFIQEFPSGLDTDALRGQMDTLIANAEIQTRQQLEQQLKERVRQQQYWDALALARRIIGEYPLSPQANVLRNQLPRLEELARKQPPQS